MIDIQKYLKSRAALIDSKIISYVPKPTKYTKPIYDAVKYSLSTGGKRIRPIMIMAACEAVSGKYLNAAAMACAIEMIHTYTLIHDDLPAMDNDDIRRGKPTSHKVYGEDIAILAGDMLNTLAFEIIADNYPKKAAELVKEVSNALGILGVVGGQVADIKSMGRSIDKNELEFISTYKTAYLFIASIRAGAIVGGATKKQLKELTSFATHIGLAFQIIDDILDYKPTDKNNYPAVLSLVGAKKAAEKELNAGLDALSNKKEYKVLRDIALYLAERKI